MKKVLYIISILIFGLFVLSGCEPVKKDANIEKEIAIQEEKTENSKIKTEPVSENIVGIWQCALSSEEFNEVYTFKDDGTYTYEIGTKKTSGTYSVEDKIIKLVSDAYGEEKYELKFNYEDSATKKTYDLAFINLDTNKPEIELEKNAVN